MSGAWEWYAGEVDCFTYDLGCALSREEVIAQAEGRMKPGEQFQIIEAKASQAAKYEGSDHVPFLKTRNFEIVTVSKEAERG